MSRYNILPPVTNAAWCQVQNPLDEEALQKEEEELEEELKEVNLDPFLHKS
jgi:hypothetical protein